MLASCLFTPSLDTQTTLANGVTNSKPTWFALWVFSFLEDTLQDALWYGCDTEIFEYDPNTIIWITDTPSFTFLLELHKRGYRGQQIRFCAKDTHITDHVVMVFSMTKVRPIRAKLVYIGGSFLHELHWVTNLNTKELITNVCLPLKGKRKLLKLGSILLTSRIG